jgi:IS30 family transposase
MKTYKHLSLDERETLLMLKAQGQSLRKIAFYLDRSPSSLCRELRRNRIPSRLGLAYRPAKAHLRARLRLKQLHRKRSPLDKDSTLQAHIVGQLQRRWSPELIAGRLRRERGRPLVSHEAIYRWIYQHARHLIPCLLRSHPRRWRRRSRSWTKNLIPRRISIHQRPFEVLHRQSPGHWEADLLWGEGRTAVQVLVERKTRLTRLRHLPNKTAQACYTALSEVFSAIPPSLRRTITYDNGVENMLHVELNKMFGLRSYFCDPFQAWQKGTVENTNGLIRRFLPKRTNLDTIAAPNFQQIEDWLNDRPRKVLEFQTPAEAFKRATVALAT